MTILNIYLAGCLVNAIFLCHHHKRFGEGINEYYGPKVTALWQLKAMAIICILSNIAFSWAIWIPFLIVFFFKEKPKKTFIRITEYYNSNILTDVTIETTQTIQEYVTMLSLENYTIDRIYPSMVSFYHPDAIGENGIIEYYNRTEFIYK